MVSSLVALTSLASTQAVISLLVGWMSDHPFGCANATVGMMLSGTTLAMILIRSRKLASSEFLASWILYTAFGFGAHSMAMVLLKIYSKGSCEVLAEGCDENETNVLAILLLLVNTVISILMFTGVKYIAEYKSYEMRLKMKAVYVTLVILGAITWMSGVLSLDGSGLIVAIGVFCMLSGMSTLLVVHYSIRSMMIFPLFLACQFVLSVILFLTGLFVTDEDGPVLRKDALTTQVLSVLNLFLGSGLAFIAYNRGWEYKRDGRATKKGLIVSSESGLARSSPHNNDTRSSSDLSGSIDKKEKLSSTDSDAVSFEVIY